ncbi:MAG: thioesterase [Bacteroidales bacterium]|jgi:acyl-ACP thioesterase|nr:thioesterase [Bacteroidales bacterium]
MENYSLYTEERKISWHEIDLRQHLRPYDFMNMAQAIATVHASLLKFGYDELIKDDDVWVLSRIKVRFLKYPKWRDNIILRTWHKGTTVSIMGLRDFDVLNDKGETLIAATSSWLIMNLETRRIARQDSMEICRDAFSQARLVDALGKPCEKIREPKGKKYISVHKVLYSDVDFNMHANNAKYIQWIMDCMDMEFLKTYSVKEFQLNYINESKLGDEIKIYEGTAGIPSDLSESNPEATEMFSRYFDGESNGKKIFQSIITFIKA